MGSTIAYFSDRSGEYELTIRPAEGSGEEKVLTKLGLGFRYTPHWSPDSKKLVFIDQAMRCTCTIWTRRRRRRSTSSWMYHGGLDALKFSWSKDSRWIAYEGP